MMVFGFFSRKAAQPSVDPSSLTPLSVPLSPAAPETSLPSASRDIQDVSRESIQQLRTPSPSIASASVARGPSSIASPAPTTTTINNSSYTPARQVSEPLVAPTPIETEPPQPAILPTRESLATLVTSVPAKVLHSYMLDQLQSATTDTLESLCSFLNTLSPPPKLHCVRCHKDYVDVENDDRSCLVPHDDDSAEVERVGRSGEARRTKEGTEYETLWGCCGKITEGDGSQGPPEGWCYEGKHTTDMKRARFRADSTPQSDKLVSCLRLNCHGIRSRMPRASTSTRKRARQTYKDASSDEDGSEGEPDSGVEEITGIERQTKKSVLKKVALDKGKGKEQAHDEDAEDKMEVDKAGSADRASSPRSKQTSPPGSAQPKRRGRPPKPKPSPEARAVSVTTPTPKRRGRPPKSRAVIVDSDAEAAGNRRTSPSPAHRGRTRSASRGRPAAGTSTGETGRSGRSGNAKTPKSRKNAGKKGEDCEDMVLDQDKPVKKRKLTS